MKPSATQRCRFRPAARACNSARTKSRIAVARPVAIAHCLFLFLAFIALAHCFAVLDFSVVYVARNASTRLPLAYRIAATWGAHEGSLLLWVTVLGLWTALVLIATEFLRARESGTRDLPFWGEWAMVGAVMLAMVVANRLILALFLVPQVALGLDLILLATNILLYPVIALAMNFALGLYRPAPGEVDTWGRRL